jgi:hypothetical protein
MDALMGMSENRSFPVFDQAAKKLAQSIGACTD